MAIKTVRQRAALAVRREPYWDRAGQGRHVGYRRTRDGGTWVAKIRDPATGKREYSALGDLADVAPAAQFGAALKLAQQFFERIEQGGRVEFITVRQAWQRYADDRRERKGAKAAADVLQRIKRHVEGQSIAEIRVDKLRAGHVQTWLRFIRTGKTPSGANRDVVPMRAALNLALRDGFAVNDRAWRDVLKPLPGADRRRELYLTRDQRRALVDAVADDHLRAFVRVLAALPLRVGALAQLTVGDFDQRQGTLRIRHDKAGAGRYVPIPAGVAASLREAARGKLPGAPLLPQWNGHPWIKELWGRGIREAVAVAKRPDGTPADLPAGVTAYTLRHAAITDLVTAGADLFTVAALAGTSIAMIQKHYGHLQADRAREVLAGLAL